MTSGDQESSSKSALRMHTKVFSHQGELVWSIENFSKFEDQTLVSNEFSIVPSCQVKWEIILTIKGSVIDSTIAIKRKDKIQRKFLGNTQCSLENPQGGVYQSYALKSCFAMYEKPDRYPEKFHTELLSRNGDTFNWNLANLKEDVLVVKIQIKLEDCCTKTETIGNEYQNSFPKHKLSTDLHRGLQMLLNEKPLSDAAFKIGDTIIPAHKSIICARSPVLRKELESDMKEAIDGVIEIKDFQPDIMKEFVSYLYTDTIGNGLSLDVIRELYAVADKYEVGSLQDKCGSVLLENLNEKTVCKTLKLADMHNDDILKEAASLYIGGNYAELKHSSDFKSLVESDPRLVLHILMCKCLD